MNTLKVKRWVAFFTAMGIALSLIPIQAMAVTPESESLGVTLLHTMDNSEELIWVYNTLKSGIESCEERIYFKDENHNISLDEFKVVYDVYRYDNPQHFWVGGSYGYAVDDTTVTYIKPTYYLTGDELTAAQSAYNAAVDCALAGLSSDMNEFEKERYLHDYLIDNVTYSFGGVYEHTAYGALVKGKAVCDGYARAFQYLLAKVGIPSFVVTGQSYGESHAWNLVKIDGDYYYVDVTWDDQGVAEPYYAFFNITTEQLLEDHTLAQTPYTLPDCTATAANYFTVKGGKVTISDLNVDLVVSQLTANNHKLFARFYVTDDPSGFRPWYYENNGKILEALGITDFDRYSCTSIGREFRIQIVADKYPHTHRLYKEEAVPATCCDTGLMECWYCPICNKYFLDDSCENGLLLDDITTPLDPDNHAGGVELRNQTTDSPDQACCSGDVYCRGCGKQLEADVGTSGAHILTHCPEVPATCKELGYKEHWHCYRCGRDFADEAGNEILEVLTLPKDLSNHVGGTTLKKESAPTCTEDGYTGDTYCKGCHIKLVSGVTVPAHHTLNQVQETPATCHDTGVKEHWHCITCDKSFSDAEATQELSDLFLPIAPTNHDGGTHTENAADPGCNEPGFTGDVYCNGCGEKLSDGQSVPAGHIISLIPEVPSTCMDAGTKEHWRCSRCDQNFSDETGDTVLTDISLPLNPSNHAGGTEIRNKCDPSCKHDGNTGDTYCLGCNEMLESGTVIPTSHVLSLIPAEAPTCMEAGNKSYWQCSCGKFYADDADLTELDSVESCTLPLDPNNHAHFKDGWEYDAEGHWQVCADCMNGTGEKTVHTYDGVSGSICAICGYVAPAVPTRGDLNGNGSKADAGDMQCLYTYLIDGSIVGAYKDSPDMFVSVADVNNDGKVDVYDLQRLYEAAAGIRSL